MQLAIFTRSAMSSPQLSSCPRNQPQMRALPEMQRRKSPANPTWNTPLRHTPVSGKPIPLRLRLRKPLLRHCPAHCRRASRSNLHLKSAPSPEVHPKHRRMQGPGSDLPGLQVFLCAETVPVLRLERTPHVCSRGCNGCFHCSFGLSTRRGVALGCRILGQSAECSDIDLCTTRRLPQSYALDCRVGSLASWRAS